MEEGRGVDLRTLLLIPRIFRVTEMDESQSEGQSTWILVALSLLSNGISFAEAF